jgi:energy-coupling factor transport system ATP-binding protein
MAINLKEVKFTYNTPKKKIAPKFILNDINLHIDSQDEFITLVGQSGAGKSTLVQLLNGLLLSNYGEVVVFDKTLSNNRKIKLKDTRKRVGLVFQFPEAQLFDETVLKDVSFGPKNFGLDNPVELAREALSVVGIDESLYETNPFNLSGGQMRRVAIAGILASNPDILVFDEPTVGLDPEGRKELLSLLKKLNEEYHKTIILVTHDMDIVASVAKRVIVLKSGMIAYDGDKTSLFKNDELLKECSLDYPNTIKILKEIKKKFNIELDEYQYSINDVYEELKKVYGNE